MIHYNIVSLLHDYVVVMYLPPPLEPLKYNSKFLSGYWDLNYVEHTHCTPLWDYKCFFSYGQHDSKITIFIFGGSLNGFHYSEVLLYNYVYVLCMVCSHFVPPQTILA